MIAPINYNIDVQSPFQAALQGYQAGAAIRDDQLQQQQKQAALVQKQQQAQVIRSLIADPNAGAEQYSRAMLLVPGLKDQLKQAWDTKSTAQQQAHLSDMTQWLSAIQSGQSQIATDAMRRRADAIESQNGAPTQESQALRTQASVIEAHPEFGGFMMKAALMAAPGGDKVVDSIVAMNNDQRAQEIQPAAVKKANADAISAETKAQYADAAEKANLASIFEDINYKKEQNRIAAMNAEANRESNDLKRQELQLKVQQAQQELTDKVNAKAADVESSRGTMDNMLNTADRILNTPLDVVKAAAGPVDSRMPTVQQNVADFEETINTLGSQAFLAQIPSIKGTGALSDAEGKKLQSALTNLSLRQSPQQLISNVREAQRLILKARENIAKRYGVQDNAPDRPNVEVPGLPPGFKILGKE